MIAIKREDQLLTVKEAAIYLNCHEMTVRKLIAKRQIPYIKKNGIGIRLRIRDLEQWLNSDVRQPSGWQESSMM
jgi:excisionase family DNA binding protein